MNRLPVILITVAAFALGVATTFFVSRRSADAVPSTTADKKPLYWYDPMKPQQHFDAPGKSPFMNMQLVPKYAGGTDEEPGSVRIEPRQVQNLGVRTALATHGTVSMGVRATGTIAFDERAVSAVQSRVPGIVEQLFVRAPLTHVAQGQPLLTLIAPDWTAAQEEYLALKRATSNELHGVRDAARQRLLLLGMGEAQIRALDQSGRAQSRITIVAPRAGVIGELSVREGTSLAVDSALMRINGLDTVWLNAAIPEAQIGRVVSGAKVKAELSAFPGQAFEGTIEELLPDLDATTRTQTARIVLRNPQHRLAPGMFARVQIAPPAAASETVLIPSEAVIATGLRQVVIVDEGHGMFRAQQVRVGEDDGSNTAIVEGVKEGDRVVLSGQFLIDSEASLTGTLARLDGQP